MGRLAAALMAIYIDAQAHQKVLLNELINLAPERQKIIVAHQRELLSVVHGLVVGLRPDLAKARSERRALVMLFFGMLNWTHTWYDPAGAIKPKALARLASDIFLAGLKSAA